MKVKIAVVQFEIQQFDPENNLKKAEQYIKKASDLKADIIIFPEDFVTGPIFNKPEYVDSSGKYLKIFQKLAVKNKIDIIPGSWIEGNSKGWYNTTYYINKSGKVKGKYRKINLWIPERKYLTPGNNISVFNTKFGKIGLIICWDLIFPEIFRKMVAGGVNIVFCPSYWCLNDAGIGIKHDQNAEIKNVNSLCTTRAFENEIILIYCNAAGKLQFGKVNDQLIGQSQITVPFKGALNILNHNKEEMFIQEINTNILQDTEKAYKIREDLKTRILH